MILRIDGMGKKFFARTRAAKMSVENTSPSSVQTSRAASPHRTCRRWIRHGDMALRVCTSSPWGFDAASIAGGVDNCLNCDFNMISMINMIISDVQKSCL
jgi:hypothetical protein